MQKIHLNGRWRARRVGSRSYLDATVPGCIHTDLLDAGLIGDPFYRDQELDAYWVAMSDWEFTRELTVPAAFLRHERVLLVCHGLDTLATVRVNGKTVAQTDNMFRIYELDVRPHLREGKNVLSITFASALKYTEVKDRERKLPGWYSDAKVGVHGYIRKEQCNFGWDWGIRAVTCGIWRDIELIGCSGSRIEDVKITQDHSRGSSVLLHLAVASDGAQNGPVRVQTRLTLEGREVARIDLPLVSGHAQGELRVPRPRLWWPNDLGDQPLYLVEVVLTADGERLDSWSKRIGLRTLELERKADAWGESFQFVINGRPFFAKGANWIPADAFNNRTGPERYRDLVASASEAHMNMLRVWGGGLYEEEVFYDLCDEYGICVWQDFMFACTTYPTYDAAFMANVEEEAKENVRRLRHHACLALWCGNNELEQGLVGPRWTDETMSWKDYSRLFDDLLPAIVREQDGATSYWPGSPHSPCGDRSDHRNPECGDAHLWDVWHGMKPFEWYRTCGHRFNSEFGFQSFPEPKTVETYTEASDRNVTSYVMEHHQRSGIGNRTIIHYMLDWFRLPTGFEETVWTSQILQGMAIKYAVEHWRRSMPRGMGTLYWQLNDTWPVASWSSIDYFHRWKALHYMARRFFEPCLLSAVEDAETGEVEVHVTSDLLEARSWELRWIVTDAAGKTLMAGKKAVRVPKSSDRVVTTLKLLKLIDVHGIRNLLVWLEAWEGGGCVAENLVMFARPKHLDLDQNPAIDLSVKRNRNGSYEVALKSKSAALWVWLELAAADARMSDSFIHLRPRRTKRISVTPREPIDLHAFEKQLVVRSLADLSRSAPRKTSGTTSARRAR